ncbi:ATP-dependent RNA helicase dbp9 [Smittium mucronatum]|uniref:RNA helicase n=1 Tax=Smittium mucronatum TaxID=133383 RepID=A0A1R0H0Z3_9FUNG|nr:ATP-dependent RNA helicase dbp9 [Smittium mucronatum]
MSSLITPKSKLFTTLDVDDRIMKALGNMKLVYMTQVQEKSIPVGLAGKDMIVQARTGSGKTAAYGVVLLNKILRSINNASASASAGGLGTKSIVLVPTLELCEQVTKALIAEQPEVVVSTPSRVLQYLKDGTLSVIETLETLVIDEADLILSFGYKNDLQEIFEYFPRACQHILMSATLPKDVSELSQLILRNPVKCIIKDEAGNHAGRLMQYAIMCNDRDKFFLTYVILKLKLISGKTIIFVNGIDRCYRLKLFLEQFSIRSCVLNSELPINSRYHIVEEFNRGVYDYIIATDEGTCNDDLDESENSKEIVDESKPNEKSEKLVEHSKKSEKPVQDLDQSISSEDEAEELNRDGSDDEDVDEGSDQENKSVTGTAPKNTKSKSNKKKSSKNMYGIVRGIDFKDASVIINFDMPTSTDAYTHRIGRTARGNKRGMSLSFIATENDTKSTKKRVQVDETLFFDKIKADQKEKGCVIEPYEFDMNQIDGLRYRCEDALRSVTKASIREAKIKEMKREIINSDLLKTHFEDRPTDLNFLRHDRTLHPTKIKPHLKNIPNYLMPKISSVSGDGSGDILNNVKEGKFNGKVPFDSKRKNKNSNRDSNKKFKGSQGGSGSKKSSFKGKRSDPLKSFGSSRSKKVRIPLLSFF